MIENNFVDTNILVYAYDGDAGRKHDIAVELMNDLWATKNGILSTQVLCEFFVTVTKKIPNPIDINHARTIVEDYISSWPIINVTEEMIIDAIDATSNHSLSFWDALIWSTAKNSGASRVYTEDFQHRFVLDNVKFINPFLELA
jgi:predicted nucleic acid-binding protein